MVYPSLEEISAQLDSSDSRDRMLARRPSFPSIDAVPLIKSVGRRNPANSLDGVRTGH